MAVGYWLFFPSESGEAERALALEMKGEQGGEALAKNRRELLLLERFEKSKRKICRSRKNILFLPCVMFFRNYKSEENDKLTN